MHRQPMRSDYRRGFTLIELLIVIAILAILAALLFPVFAHAREQALRSVCLSNLKQIAAASQMYLQDYDETFLWNPWRGEQDRFPYRPPQRSDCPPAPRVYYVVLLQPYLRSAEVFTCPNFFGYPFPTYGPYLRSLDKERYRRVGYSFNTPIVGDRCQPWTLASLKSSPSEVALFGDSDETWGINHVREVEGDLYWPARAGNSWHPSEPQFRGVSWRRHQTGLQFAYVDGHVRFDRAVRGGRMIPWYSVEFDGRYRAGYFPHAKLE